MAKGNGTWLNYLTSPFYSSNPEETVTTTTQEEEWELVDPLKAYSPDETGGTIFHRYAQDGNFEQLSTLIGEIGAPSTISALLGQKDKNGYIPLHFACKYGHKEIIKLLWERMEHTDKAATTEDKDGYNALHFACHGSNDPEIIELLSSHIDIAGPAANSFTPLCCAAVRGNDKIVAYLLPKMLVRDVISCTENPPQIIAAEKSDIKLNHIEKYGFSAFHLAVKQGHLAVGQLFLNYYSDPNNQDANTPRINEFNFDVGTANQPFSEQKTEDGKGYTALHLAARGGFLELVQTLLAHNPNLRTIRDKEGNLPLHLASSREVMEELLRTQDCPKLDEKNKDGNTPLHSAVQNSKVEVVKYLLFDYLKELYILSKDCHAPNNYGQTPLHLSSNPVISLSLNQSLLNYATKWKENIRDFYKADKEGNTVLHCASYYGLSDMVQSILNSLGLDNNLVNTVNNNGGAPIHLAQNDEVATKLLLHTKNDILFSSVNRTESKLLRSKVYGSFNTMPTLDKGHEKFSEGNILHIAVKKNFTSTAGRLLNKGYNITELLEGIDGNDNSPFHFVASEEMGELLLPHIAGHIDKVNKDGQTILHKVVQKNLCSFVGELIKQNSTLLSAQDQNGGFPIDLAGTPEMARILATSSSKELLKEVIANHKGSCDHGVGLIISELPPDLLHQAVSDYRQLGKDKAENEKSEGLSVISYLENERQKTEDTLKSLRQIAELKDNASDFEIVDGENITEDINYNEVLFKYANLSYALEQSGELSNYYEELLKKAPEYIEQVLSHLAASEEQGVNSLLATMREGNYELWGTQLPQDSKINLLYKFADAGKNHIVSVLFKAKIPAPYFKQALQYAIDNYDRKPVDNLLKTLQESFADDRNNELWHVSLDFFYELLRADNYHIASLFFTYTPNEVVFPTPNDHPYVLGLIKSAEMLLKLVTHYPTIKENPILSQNIDSTGYCIKVVAECNRALTSQQTDLHLLLKKGYALELIGQTQQALKCYLEAKKWLPEYHPEENNDEGHLDGWNIKSLLFRQIPSSSDVWFDDMKSVYHYVQVPEGNTIIETVSGNNCGSRVKRLQELYPNHPKAIALSLSNNYWVNISIIPCENKSVKIICPSPKGLPPSLPQAISEVQGTFIVKGLPASTIYLDLPPQTAGSAAFVVDNLVRIANFQRELTEASITGILASHDDLPNLTTNHKLILEAGGCYSNMKFSKLLEILLGDEAHIFLPVDMHNQSALVDMVAPAIHKVLTETSAAVIPLYPHKGHWSGLIIKRDNEGGVIVTYSDATGNPFTLEANAEAIIASILQHSTKATFIDLQQPQTKTGDNGTYAIENIVSLVKKGQLDLQKTEEDQSEVAKKHIQILCNHGIPVRYAEPVESKEIATPIRVQVKTMEDCLTTALEKYKQGNLEEAFKYYTGAAKFYNPEPANSTGFGWVSERATGTIIARLFAAVQETKANEQNFNVISLKSESSHAALLVAQRENMLRVVHLDAQGIFLCEKPRIISALSEIIGKIPLYIVDVAKKVKGSFEEVLTKLQQVNCELNVEEQLADYLEEQPLIIGETIGC